ncbi:uncharacterized protein CLUP02_13314 [Colletotrichum lupini]|uniref:Uncharacterized protein n=1 Tax=Colletotrichum lupini TaxID=145971 RepID=A0A9Q8T2G2_9PEZI|nr:uncharacterized protein CLUP02_13314 [Colletotrichum lupini]UQC87795.1 hypothetical protein CLUP02_13314 [Colletotrichum lupini]
MSQNPFMDVILAIVCYHKERNENFDNEAERDAHRMLRATMGIAACNSRMETSGRSTNKQNTFFAISCVLSADSLMGMHSNGEHAKHHTLLAVDSPRSTGKQGTNCQNHLVFWCGRCGKGLKYDDPAIKRDLKLQGIGQSLRLDHIQKHVLEDGGIHWQWPSPGVGYFLGPSYWPNILDLLRQFMVITFSREILKHTT